MSHSQGIYFLFSNCHQLPSKDILKCPCAPQDAFPALFQKGDFPPSPYFSPKER